MFAVKGEVEYAPVAIDRHLQRAASTVHRANVAKQFGIEMSNTLFESAQGLDPVLCIRRHCVRACTAVIRMPRTTATARNYPIVWPLSLTY